MAKRKKESITQALIIMYTPQQEDKEALAYFEHKLMEANGLKDCCSVSNAQILRHCIMMAYTADKKNRKGGSGELRRKATRASEISVEAEGDSLSSDY